MKFYQDARYATVVKEPFAPLLARFHALPETEKALYRADADRALTAPIPMLTASLYIDFARTGNRTHFEDPYHARRNNLLALLLGSLCGESAKYTDKIIDLLWAILEESTWVIPAHNVSREYELLAKPLPDIFEGDRADVDLFAAATGALLSAVLCFDAPALDAVSPVITERIRAAVTHRILRPFLLCEMRWETNFINNWVPWIVSNVLFCASVCLPDKVEGVPAPQRQMREMRAVITRAMLCLDRFTDTYGEDGGCNEGASYWGAAVGTLFDACVLLSDLTAGEVDATKLPLLHRMCRYLPDLALNPEKHFFVNFADCGPRVSPDATLLARMGERFADPVLSSFAEALGARTAPVPVTYYFLYRVLNGVLWRGEHPKSKDVSSAPAGEPISAPISRCENLPDGGFVGAPDAFYPNLGVAVLRRGDFFLAAKGGHNGESHNHNDVGSFILAHRGVPLLIDPGVGVYTRETFNEKRYTLFTMQSSYHNLPEPNGTMQAPGKAYRANTFALSGDTVTADFAGAYPPEAGLAALSRRLTLTEAGLTLTDTVDGTGETIWNLMLAEKPRQTADGFSVAGCAFTFDGTFAVEEIDISGDRNLQSGWERDTLYRVRIRTGKAGKQTFSLTVR